MKMTLMNQKKDCRMIVGNRVARHAKCLFRVSVAALCMFSCTVQVPSDIIQQEEMEDLLYDYHLMQAMAGDLSVGEKYKRKLYEQYVFDKHGVTEAEFDSSLAWYMRHTRELEEVYTKLHKRFKQKQKMLEAYVRPEERSNRISLPGDTVNVWDDYRIFRLTASPSASRMTFSIPADSNFHKNDFFEWKIKAHFMEDTSRVRAVMALTIFYDKDTVGCSIPLDASGEYVLALKGDSAASFKEMMGFIHYYPTDDNLRLSEKAKAYYKEKATEEDSLDVPVRGILPSALEYGDLLISDIALMRYHQIDTVVVDESMSEVANSDSLKTTDKNVDKKGVENEKGKQVKDVKMPEKDQTPIPEKTKNPDMLRLDKRRSLQKK